jgi:hypothetical protein
LTRSWISETLEFCHGADDLKHEAARKRAEIEIVPEANDCLLSWSVPKGTLARLSFSRRTPAQVASL